MNPASILALGFLLGMRHATDADHVVAVSTIVSRERTLRSAAPIGILWGLGHTLTILIVGSAIILFGVVIPPHVGLGMELSVALMLIVLGLVNVRGVLRDGVTIAGEYLRAEGAPQPRAVGSDVGVPRRSMRPLVVGIVHGLAGSAAIALLVLGTIHQAFWAVCYLLIFGAGTVAGMLVITTAFALPVAATARRFNRLHRALGLATGLASVLLGVVLCYEIVFTHGLFSTHARWTPE